MKFTYSPAKDKLNREKHGLSLADASAFSWDEAWIRLDCSLLHNELRETALVPKGNRLFCVVFVERNGSMRIISLRRATKQEIKNYVEQA